MNHNQIEFFKSRVLINPIKLFNQELFPFKTVNLNNDFLYLNDFIELFKDELTPFQQNILTVIELFKKPTEWVSFIDKDLRFIYVANKEFHKLTGSELRIINPQDYLTVHLKGLISEPESNLIKSVKDYNLIDSLVSELNNHLVSLEGVNYYLISWTANHNLRDEIKDFYGEQPDLMPLINEFRHQQSFEYGVLINKDTLMIEQVFNRSFADLNDDYTKLIIKPVGQVIADEFKKLRRPNSVIKINSERNSTFTDSSRMIIRYAAISRNND